jgi:hypothetical protein
MPPLTRRSKKPFDPMIEGLLRKGLAGPPKADQGGCGV